MANVIDDERIRIRVYEIFRDQFKSDIDRFVKFLEEDPASTKDRKKLLCLQYEQLREKHNTFQEKYRKLKLVKDFESKHNEIVELYVAVIAKAGLLLEDLESGVQFPEGSAESTCGREANEAEPRQLCEVSMQDTGGNLASENPSSQNPFSGQKTQWPSFYTSFKVIAESDLDDSEKLKNLQSSLSGKVKSAVDSYDDFSDAWNDLKEAFNNTRYFIINKAKLLHDLKVSENSKESLNKLLSYIKIYPKWLQVFAQTDKDFIQSFQFCVAINTFDDETRANYLKLQDNIKNTQVQKLRVDDIVLYVQKKLISLYEKNETSRNRGGTSREDRSLAPPKKHQAMDQ